MGLIESLKKSFRKNNSDNTEPDKDNFFDKVQFSSPMMTTPENSFRSSRAMNLIDRWVEADNNLLNQRQVNQDLIDKLIEAKKKAIKNSLDHAANGEPNDDDIASIKTLDDLIQRAKEGKPIVSPESVVFSPANMLKLVKTSYPNSIRGQLFSESPMQTPTSSVNYIQPVYGSTITDLDPGEKIIN